MPYSKVIFKIHVFKWCPSCKSTYRGPAQLCLATDISALTMPVYLLKTSKPADALRIQPVLSPLCGPSPSPLRRSGLNRNYLCLFHALGLVQPRIAARLPRATNPYLVGHGCHCRASCRPESLTSSVFFFIRLRSQKLNT